MKQQIRQGSSHQFGEHTGEVRVHLSAPDFASLLAEAGRALAELLSEESPHPLDAPDRIVIPSADRAALLVDWLNELIFLSETRKRVYSVFELLVANDRDGIVAHVQGWPASRLRTQVKAATFHGLSVRDGPEGLAAEVVLDV
jgi:SHS2 domain-containing protein